MKLRDVNSSNLAAIGYDRKTKTLELRFTSGGVYDYAEVPLSVYRGLLAADSKGTYFHSQIKGKFDTTRVGG